DVDVAAPPRVLLDHRGPELDEEVDAILDPPARVQGLAHHARVLVEVVLLACGAGPAVGDVDLHLAQLVHVGAVGGVGGDPPGRVARGGHHRADLRQVDGVDAAPVDRALVGADRLLAQGLDAHAGAPGHYPRQHAVVGLHDPRAGGAL